MLALLLGAPAVAFLALTAFVAFVSLLPDPRERRDEP